MESDRVENHVEKSVENLECGKLVENFRYKPVTIPALTPQH